PHCLYGRGHFVLPDFLPLRSSDEGAGTALCDQVVGVMRYGTDRYFSEPDDYCRQLAAADAGPVADGQARPHHCAAGGPAGSDHCLPALSAASLAESADPAVRGFLPCLPAFGVADLHLLRLAIPGPA